MPLTASAPTEQLPARPLLEAVAWRNAWRALVWSEQWEARVTAFVDAALGRLSSR